MTHYLTKYARFSSTKDLDATALQHLDRHSGRLNRTDRAVFEMIRCYSVKFGAAHLKHETIQSKLGISNTTVRNALRKLASLDMIERMKFVRPVLNGTGANVYTILPSDGQPKTDTSVSPNKSHDSKSDSPSDENEPSFYQSNSIKELSITYLHGQNKLSTDLFSKMKSLLSITGDTSQTRELYGIHRSISGKLLKYEIHRHKTALYEELAIRATSITVMSMKRKKIRSVPAYFSGVLRQLHSEQLDQELREEYESHPNDYTCVKKTAKKLGLSGIQNSFVEYIHPGECCTDCSCI